jgi:ATP-binding cassette subfamily C (CFTR/MRP) protein 1
LILWTRDPITSVAVPSASIALVAGLATIIIVAMEHNRSVRPSSVLQVYLIASIFAGAVQIRTLFLRRYVPTIARLQSTVLACQMLLLVIESWPKTRWVMPAEVSFSPEDFSGILGQSLYLWLNPLFFKGNRHILTIDDLSPISADLQSSHLQKGILKAWNKHGSSNPYSFLLSNWSLYKWQILAQMVPRLAVTGFTYSQTFLINSAVDYLETPSALRNINHAYGLIAATASSTSTSILITLLTELGVDISRNCTFNKVNSRNSYLFLTKRS